MHTLATVFSSLIAGVRSVNARYAKPQIEMTPFVKICLFTLRAYLFVLIGLMIYKFVVTLK